MMSFDDSEFLAGLTSSRGYQILVREFRSELEVIEKTMLAGNDDSSKRLELNDRWRQMKRCVQLIENLPREAAERVRKAVEDNPMIRVELGRKKVGSA